MTLSLPGSPPPRAARPLPPELAAGLAILAARCLGRGPDADDAVQEVLARAVEALAAGRVPDDVPVGVFVYGIARHVIADVLRERARRGGPAPDADLLPARGPSPLEQVISTEERERVARALAALPRADQELLHACYVAGERLADIAARLGEPAERVRKRKSRALARLRLALDPAGAPVTLPYPDR